MQCGCPWLLLLRQHWLQIEEAWQHRQKASTLLYSCRLSMLMRALRDDYKPLLLCFLAGDPAKPLDKQQAQHMQQKQLSLSMLWRCCQHAL